TPPRAGGRAGRGVAASPLRRPESPTTSHDTEVLVAKEKAGADFAITQVFFEPSVYCGLLARAEEAGIRMPIVPGLVPATNPRRLERLAAISGVEAPRELLHQLEIADRKSTRLNSSHVSISYAVFCLKKKQITSE